MIVLAEQAPPVPGRKSVNMRVLELLPRLLAQRQAKGMKTYGRPLETFNGRDVHRNLLDELVDAVQYAVQAQMEREALEREIVDGRSGTGIVDAWRPVMQVVLELCSQDPHGEDPLEREERFARKLRSAIRQMPMFAYLEVTAS
jgi:hypothetical protein